MIPFVPYVSRLKRLRWLSLRGGTIIPSALRQLRSLADLRILRLEGCGVRDDGLAAVGRISSLRQLFLDRNPFRGPGLRHLAGLRQLELLDLSGTSVGDAALLHLRPLSRLRRLILNRTAITDVGMATVAGLGRLIKLDLMNTRITDVEVLEHRHPVRVHRFLIRRQSGGQGAQQGGDGLIRELEFTEAVQLSLLTQHRAFGPAGAQGGMAGAAGRQWVQRRDGSRIELSSIAEATLRAGDRIIVETPGGGGWGSR